MSDSGQVREAQSAIAADRHFVNGPFRSAVIAVKSDDRGRPRDRQVTPGTDDVVFEFEWLHVDRRTFRTHAVFANRLSLHGRSGEAAADDGGVVPRAKGDDVRRIRVRQVFLSRGWFRYGTEQPQAKSVHRESSLTHCRHCL